MNRFDRVLTLFVVAIMAPTVVHAADQDEPDVKAFEEMFGP